MRKCALWLLLICLLTAPACIGEAAGEVDWSALRYEEPVTLTLMITDDDGWEAYAAICKRIEDRLNIHTELRFRPGDVEGENYVKSLLAMGEMTDLCLYYSGALFRSLDPQAYFVDISGEPFVQALDETYLQAVTVDGKLYGVPAGTMYAGAWIYNVAVHEELGLQVPRTWDEMMDNCQKIKEAGLVPVLGAYDTSWSTQLVLLIDQHNLVHEDPNWVEAYNAGTATFSDSPAAMRGFEKLYELAALGYLQPDAMNTSYEEAGQMFADGEGVYMPVLTSWLPELEAEQRFDLFGQPGDDPDYQGITQWLPLSLYISNSSENIEAAKRWIAFFISDEGQRVFMEHTDVTGPSVLKNVDISSMPDVPFLQTLAQYQQEGHTALALEFVSAIKGPDLTSITQQCALGLITPQEAARQYDEDTRRIALLLNMYNDVE